MILPKKLLQGQCKSISKSEVTHLFINIPTIGNCEILLYRSMEAFIGLGIEVPGDTFCNDIIEEV